MSKPLRWVAAKYSKKRVGFGLAGGPAVFFYVAPVGRDLTKDDDERMRVILDALDEDEIERAKEATP